MIALVICLAFVVGALVSRALDRIEDEWRRRRDDRRFNRFWTNHVSAPYDSASRKGPR